MYTQSSYSVLVQTFSKNTHSEKARNFVVCKPSKGHWILFILFPPGFRRTLWEVPKSFHQQRRVNFLKRSCFHFFAHTHTHTFYTKQNLIMLLIFRKFYIRSWTYTDSQIMHQFWYLSCRDEVSQRPISGISQFEYTYLHKFNFFCNEGLFIPAFLNVSIQRNWAICVEMYLVLDIDYSCY